METFDGMLYVHVYLSLWVLGQALNLSPTSFESRSQLTLKMQDTVKSHQYVRVKRAIHIISTLHLNVRYETSLKSLKSPLNVYIMTDRHV